MPEIAREEVRCDDTAKCIDWLARLISFDTTSRNSNLGLIETVRDTLVRRGASCRLLLDRDGTKASLLASVGPAIPGGIVLSGHTDVVPVDGQQWTTPPFELVRRADRLHGRGACDMKGFIAAALALIEDLDIGALQRPLHLALSYDEEVGCLAAAELASAVAGTLPRPVLVVVGEPTGMRAGVAHKGLRLCRTAVRATPRHSSQTHLGVNAIAVAASLVAKLEGIAAAWRCGAPAPLFAAPGYSTLSVNQIAGGFALNTIPGQCDFIWDIRAIELSEAPRVRALFDDYVRLELLPALKAQDPGAEILTQDLVDVMPFVRESREEIRAFRAAFALQEECAFAFATEAGFFQSQGLPTLLCGPGSIEQAHTTDEYIEASQIQACVRFMSGLARSLQSGTSSAA